MPLLPTANVFLCLEALGRSMIPVCVSPFEKPCATSHCLHFNLLCPPSPLLLNRKCSSTRQVEPNPKHRKPQWRKIVYFIMNVATQEDGKLKLKGPNSPIQGSGWVFKGMGEQACGNAGGQVFIGGLWGLAIW